MNNEENKSNINKNKTDEKGTAKNKTLSKVRKTQEKKSNQLVTKVVLRLVTIFSLCMIGFALIFGAYIFLSKKVFNEKKETHSAMVTRQLLLCQELVTEKYRYSDIITLKKSLGFTKSYSIVKFTGIIRAGLEDTSKIKYSISKNGKKIKIHIPDAVFLGNEIVSMEVFDEKRSVFVPIKTQEVFDEIETVKNDIAEEVAGEGFLTEAKNEASKVIIQMMYAIGFTEVEIQ